MLCGDSAAQLDNIEPFIRRAPETPVIKVESVNIGNDSQFTAARNEKTARRGGFFALSYGGLATIAKGES